MRRANREAAGRLSVETLEGRALLSGIGVLKGVVAHPAVVASAVKTDPQAVAAIMGALRGGAGSEFVTLIKRIPNYMGVINQFVRGQRTSFSGPGVVAKTPAWQPAYTGTRYDHMTATLAGAVVLPGNTLELAGVMRGPYDEAVPSYLVFGIDRGAGAKRGPLFASRPKITPDALVTIAIGSYGQNATATVTDLTTGAVTAIDASKVQVQGAVARVWVDLSALPSKGLKTSGYRFAMWTASQPGGDITTVGSFVAESSMTPVGVLSPGKR
jgi:hypothetical protein